jgi:hypothetical protein
MASTPERVCRLLVVIALSSLTSALPRRAAATPETDAEKPWAVGVSPDQRAKALDLFKDGNRFFEQSQYAQAFTKYREALEVWDHPSIRYNMAVALVHLDKPLSAYENLIQALRYGQGPLAPELYSQAQTYKKLLLGQLAEVKIRCEERDAEVSLDGERLFAAPGEATRLVTPGMHRVVATKTGFLPLSRSLTLLPGKQIVEELQLVALKEVKTDRRLERRWAVWKPWMVAVAGVAVGLIGLPLLLQSKSDIESYDSYVNASCTRGCTPSQIPAAVGDLKPKAALENGFAIGMFGLGGALVATGVALVIVNQPRVVETKPTRVAWTPWLGTGVAGAAMDLRF